jgi:hypothetical protein
MRTYNNLINYYVAFVYMINFHKFLYSHTGKVIISIIWGLGLAALFRRRCNGRDCRIIQYKGPKQSDITDTFYHYESPPKNAKSSFRTGKHICYKYTPYLVECPETDSGLIQECTNKKIDQ